MWDFLIDYFEDNNQFDDSELPHKTQNIKNFTQKKIRVLLISTNKPFYQPLFGSLLV